MVLEHLDLKALAGQTTPVDQEALGQEASMGQTTLVGKPRTQAIYRTQVAALAIRGTQVPALAIHGTQVAALAIHRTQVAALVFCGTQVPALAIRGTQVVGPFVGLGWMDHPNF